MPANTLLKTRTSTYVPGTPGVVGSPGTPYLPARQYTTMETQCSYLPDLAALAAQGITRTWTNPGYSEGGWVYNLPPGMTGISVPYVYQCVQVPRTVFAPEQAYVPPTPAIPATASKVITDFNLGWNSRARSIAAYPGAMEATFKVSRSVSGAVVGLNTRYSQTGYADIQFAFYLSQGVAKVVEAGVHVATPGAYTGDTVFKVRRLRGKVQYFMDGVQVREVANDSAPAHLDAALYSGDDSVYDPTIAGLSVGDGVLQALEGIGGNTAYGTSAGRLQPLAGGGRTASRGDNTLSSLTGLGGDYPYAEGRGVLPILAAAGQGSGLAPGYALSDGVLVPLTGNASGLTGGIGSGAGVLAAIDGLASEGPYGESMGMLSGLTGWGRGLSASEKTLLSLFSFGTAGSAVSPAAGMVLVLNSSLTAASVLTLDRSALLAFMSAATAATPFAAAGQFALALLTQLRSTSLQALLDTPTDVWVMNLETGGFTRYEGFDFTSFAKVGGAYYGCKPDGIYALDGDTDAGEPIRAMVSFGKQNFGTSASKRVTNAYVGASGAGRLFLKVLAEGQEYTYAQRSYDEHIQTQRFDIGKGLRVNWLEFELYNADGEDFELASVEFAAVPLSRRI